MGMSAGGGKGSRVAMSEINVTPFVDVMLVLLIIFMVTAPMMQQGLDIELPETESTGVETNDEPFVLSIKRNKKIFAGESELKLKNLNELSDKLAAIFETRKNKQIYLQADKSVDYGYVAQAIGEIRSAGIFSIGLITVPVSGN